MKILKLRIISSLALIFLNAFVVCSQTPVANRIKAVVRNLPKSAVVVAKYTDNHRHSLYYINEHRLFCYDVLTGKNEETVFINTSYENILSSWLSPDGNFFFITIDKGKSVPSYMDDGQELWRFDSRTLRSYKVGQGFFIERRKGCYIIKKGVRCLNPSANYNKQSWIAQDHYYDLYGKVIWAKDEYEVKSR